MKGAGSMRIKSEREWRERQKKNSFGTSSFRHQQTIDRRSMTSYERIYWTGVAAEDEGKKWRRSYHDRNWRANGITRNKRMDKYLVSCCCLCRGRQTRFTVTTTREREGYIHPSICIYIDRRAWCWQLDATEPMRGRDREREGKGNARLCTHLSMIKGQNMPRETSEENRRKSSLRHNDRQESE